MCGLGEYLYGVSKPVALRQPQSPAAMCFGTPSPVAVPSNQQSSNIV